MPWFPFTDDEAKTFKAGLRLLDTPEARALCQRAEEIWASCDDPAYADVADQSVSDPDEVEGRPEGETYVSHSDDGAYVMAWIWVDKDQVEGRGEEPDWDEIGGSGTPPPNF